MKNVPTMHDWKHDVVRTTPAETGSYSAALAGVAGLAASALAVSALAASALLLLVSALSPLLLSLDAFATLELLLPRLSLIYQPEPLKTIPTG